MTTQRELTAAARKLHRLLKSSNLKAVFAESCTGGLVAATLTRIPGISQYLCGSAVVYQVETKHAWLGIPRKTLEKADAVTAAVAHNMAVSVLKNTPQADVAASITGHLGPDAPPALDGLFFVGLAARRKTGKRNSAGIAVHTVKGRLLKGEPKTPAGALRLGRQREAAAHVFAELSRFLERRG